ncbi:conserved hypothetical protein [Theileria orientalis strain Shintoku]|uniref:Uncharacterized protein n=1 Tax=Theileria orientalis strain Shintoku TaxID=869250 RepID=J7M816_THEOR|nr:conserved hypothetical protein [Theileria orientalis strain Shintoku]BAM38548.1 conserved hypothetical protein [Theileria orientalis strain Shintoku]|eukprot:XP_009688849.1 conserved hypothetical protein [Theileria orientalis strain Shintoku]
MNKMESTPIPHLRIVPTSEATANRDHFSVPRPLNFRTDSDFATSSSSRLFSSVLNHKTSNGEEVVLFAIHPLTIIRPLRRRVYKKINDVLESLINSLQSKGLSKTVILSRLQNTRWFLKMFDYEGIGSLINVFKTYLCHSDTLVVPLIFKEVYDAYSSEMDRTYSKEVLRIGLNSDLDSRRAFIMGGIDFTEETMLSTYRNPYESLNNDLPTSSIWRISGTNIRNFNPIPTLASTQSNVQSVANTNRDFFLNEQNVSVFTAFLPKLRGILSKKKEELSELNKRLEQERKLTNEHHRLLLTNTYKHVYSAVEFEFNELEECLLTFENIFDIKYSQSKFAKSLDELHKNMNLIDSFVKNKVL